MATHYTCDRCGVDIRGAGRPIQLETEIDWPDAQKVGGKSFEPVRVSVDIVWPGRDGDRPDLCQDCYAHILRDVASRFDTDRDVREAAS